MFNSEPELLAEGVPAMHLYFFGIFMMSPQFAGQSTFTALGKAKQAVFFSLVAKGNHRHSTDTVVSDCRRTWNKWSLSLAEPVSTSSAEPPALSR